MTTIRLARTADIPAVVALDTIAAFNEERREAISAWVAALQCHVAVDGNRILGYLALTRSFFRSPFIEMLMVAAAARRTGVGRFLVMRAIELTGGDEKLWASTNASNAPMRTLLEDLGFVASGVVENLDPGDPERIYLHWPAGAPRA